MKKSNLAILQFSMDYVSSYYSNVIERSVEYGIYAESLGDYLGPTPDEIEVVAKALIISMRQNPNLRTTITVKYIKIENLPIDLWTAAGRPLDWDQFVEACKLICDTENKR